MIVVRVLVHKLVHFASLTDSFIFNFQNYYSQTGKTEHQKYFWNVIVSQEKPIAFEKLNRKQDR